MYKMLLGFLVSNCLKYLESMSIRWRNYKPILNSLLIEIIIDNKEAYLI